jgi:hypothetical protein
VVVELVVVELVVVWVIDVVVMVVDVVGTLLVVVIVVVVVVLVVIEVVLVGSVVVVVEVFGGPGVVVCDSHGAIVGLLCCVVLCPQSIPAVESSSERLSGAFSLLGSGVPWAPVVGSAAWVPGGGVVCWAARAAVSAAVMAAVISSTSSIFACDAVLRGASAVPFVPFVLA